jgi:integrase
MRPGEALRLELTDLDAARHQLRIHRCKFSPERTIPLHSTTKAALERYRQARLRFFPSGQSLFVGATGRPLAPRLTERVFLRLTRGIQPNGQRPAVRLLDFRHSFASRWIASWSQQSQPIAHHLLLLARYLGHRTFNSTWWYVTSSPATLRAAGDTFRHFHEEGL